MGQPSIKKNKVVIKAGEPPLKITRLENGDVRIQKRVSVYYFDHLGRQHEIEAKFDEEPVTPQELQDRLEALMAKIRRA